MEFTFSCILDLFEAIEHIPPFFLAYQEFFRLCRITVINFLLIHMKPVGSSGNIGNNGLWQTAGGVQW